MNPLTALRSPLRWTTLKTLLLLAMALRAFIPAGFMAGTDAGGLASVVICSGGFAKPIHVAASEAGGQADHDGALGEHPCPFAWAASGYMSAPVLLPVEGAFGPAEFVPPKRLGRFVAGTNADCGSPLPPNAPPNIINTGTGPFVFAGVTTVI